MPARPRDRDENEPNASRREGDLERTDRKRGENQRGQRRADAKVTPKDLGFAFDSQATDRGLKIDRLATKSIASRADFHEGDIIVSINDHRVRSQDEFIRYIDLDARERLTVIVLRDNREVTLYLDPTVIYEEVVVTSAGGWLGVDLVDRERQAAVVHRIHPESPAEAASLRAGDRILAVEGTEIRSPQHLGEVVGQMRPGSRVEIKVERNRRSMLVEATLGEKKEVATRRTEIR